MFCYESVESYLEDRSLLLHLRAVNEELTVPELIAMVVRDFKKHSPETSGSLPEPTESDR